MKCAFIIVVIVTNYWFRFRCIQTTRAWWVCNVLNWTTQNMEAMYWMRAPFFYLSYYTKIYNIIIIITIIVLIILSSDLNYSKYASNEMCFKNRTYNSKTNQVQTYNI